MKMIIVLMAGVLLFNIARGQDRAAAAGKVMSARPWLAMHVSAGGVRLELRGVYVCGGLLWVSLQAENHSPIDFRGSGVRFSIRDRHAVRREAVQEIILVPVVSRGVSLLGSDSSAVFCYGLLPRVPGRKRELVMEWSERNGDRRMRLLVNGKEIIKARKL